MEKKEKSARNVRPGFRKEKLNKLLAELHVSNEQFAIEIGCHIKSVKRWTDIENDTDPGTGYVIAMVEYFKKDVEYFYNDEWNDPVKAKVEESENVDFDIKQYNDSVINQELFYGCFIPLISIFLGVVLLGSTGKLTSFTKSKLYFVFLLIVEATIIFSLLVGCLFSKIEVCKVISLYILILSISIRLISFIILVVRKCKSKYLHHSY